MRKPAFVFLLVLTSIFAFAGLSFGQDPVKPECPTIDVTGPPGIVAPGGAATFTATVNQAGPDLRYQWSISAGEITSGQGTPTITVKQPIQTLTVTVEITGLPKGCPNMASEMAIGDPPEQPILLGRFSGRIRAKEKARFNKMWNALEADPNARGVIYLTGTVRQVKANKQMITSFITRMRKDLMRITFVIGPVEDELTEFWFVPVGATEPEFRPRGRKAG